MGPEQVSGAWIKLQSGLSLTPDDEFMIELTNGPWLTYWENNHYQYQIGMLTDEQWTCSRNSLRLWFQIPTIRKLWPIIKEQQHESFVAELDELIAEAEPIR